ncbi:sensor histidine kinase [Paenibacillus wynnii]|uniref:sensor histidine kinase n=1 Tax=Paenibacillus wynnii TaxID=268407 RepID=UPI00279169C7|nr:HAMP domain-containing sensor histidine kinase [Paenibacillus wynnii]MDQ0192857.1 signal transduction histidine kinase [Paenibacillus wynnii]
MDYDKEIKYLREQKDTIISNWSILLDRDDRIYAGQIDITKREIVASLFIDFITDIHIAAEAHPFLDIAREWSEKNFSNYKSISSILDVNDKLRSVIMDIINRYPNQENALRFLGVLIDRQNIFFREYCETHMRIYAEVLNEKDSKIDKLHDDRLNLIGKMASSMAHEIRNPLTSIAGFLKLIRHDISNRKQSNLDKYIDVIDEEFTSINMHITGFLSFSRNNAFQEKKTEVSVTEVIHSTLYLLNPRLNNENIMLTINFENDYFIYIQKISIQQVISNIVSNAIDSLIDIKTDRAIRIECFQDEENINIHIVNNGPNISEEIKHSLFLPFITNKENGTGLGLAICKELMIKNNGNIDFESNESETNFMLSFKKADKLDLPNL